MPGAKPRLLENVRILDLTSIVFGPYATRMLADLGADVIKIEPPTGDQFRFVGKPAVTPGMGGCHMTLNRGKRSLVLDLKKQADKLLLREMLGEADVFIHNVRTEAIERLGFDFEAVRELCPEIIYVHCVGFGSGGPYASRQAYDDVIQAASGATTLLSRVDGEARPRYIPTTMADKVAGLYAAQAVLAAIVHRLRTGEGQHVEVPMFETFTDFLYQEHLFGRTFEPPTGPIGYGRQLEPARQPFPTADGYVSIVPYTDADWIAILTMIGRTELLEDERFATPRDRVRNTAALNQLLADATPAKPTVEWLTLLEASRIPAMPVRDMRDILDDPHLAATEFFRSAEHPTEGEYFQMQPPLRFSAAPDLAMRPAPRLGEHDAEFKNGATEASASDLTNSNS